MLHHFGCVFKIKCLFTQETFLRFHHKNLFEPNDQKIPSIRFNPPKPKDHTMKKPIKNSTPPQKTPIYTKVGMAFLLVCGVVYLFQPDRFRDGFFYLAVGVVLLLTIMMNIISKRHYDMVTLLVGIYFCLQGVHTFFALEIPYISVITIGLLVLVVLLSASSLVRSLTKN